MVLMEMKGDSSFFLVYACTNYNLYNENIYSEINELVWSSKQTNQT